MKKRILMLLSVVALMVVMLAMAVTPAFPHDEPCTGQNPGIISALSDPAVYAANAQYDRDQDGYICAYTRYDKEGTPLDYRYRDDHSLPFGVH